MKQVKRASIFAFYDEVGIVDDYIIYMLKEMKKVSSFQCVVVNGLLTQSGKDKLASVCDEIIYRENVGLDVSGYKEAVLTKYDILKGFDEVVFFNQTIFGPFYPFENLFSDMEKRICDFWGITCHPGLKINDIKDCPNFAKHLGYVPKHLQSYFIVIKKDMFSTTEFYNFFENLPEVNSYGDAVGYFEIMFTKYFNDNGFKSEAYINDVEIEKFTDYALMCFPKKIIKDYKCPVAKRKSFLMDRINTTTAYYGYSTQELYEYIKNETDYDFSLILNNLTRTVDLKTLTYSFTPCYIVEQNNSFSNKKDTALIMEVTQNIQIEYIKEQLEKIQKEAEIFVLVENNELAQNFNEFQVIKNLKDIENRIEKFKYIAKITNNIEVINDGFYDIATLENAFLTIAEIRNNEKILTENTDFSVLITFPSYKGEKISKGLSWQDVCQEFKEQFSFKVQLNANAEPLICSDGMFFAKTEVFIDYLKLDVQKLDVILNKARISSKEILIPLIAQKQQALTAFIFKKEFAFADLLNLNSIKNEFLNVLKINNSIRIDQILFETKNKINHYDEHHNDMTLKQAFSAKLKLKEKLYIVKNLFF